MRDDDVVSVCWEHAHFSVFLTSFVLTPFSCAEKIPCDFNKRDQRWVKLWISSLNGLRHLQKSNSEQIWRRQIRWIVDLCRTIFQNLNERRYSPSARQSIIARPHPNRQPSLHHRRNRDSPRRMAQPRTYALHKLNSPRSAGKARITANSGLYLWGNWGGSNWRANKELDHRCSDEHDQQRWGKWLQSYVNCDESFATSDLLCKLKFLSWVREKFYYGKDFWGTWSSRSFCPRISHVNPRWACAPTIQLHWVIFC